MKVMRFGVGLLCVLGVALTSQAGELGDKAPALAIKDWVKGAAVDVTQGDKVYVVEFWATWCGPCRDSIPHITEMQKKYGDKVTFIGVSDEPLDKVKPFVEKMGDKMDYVVATDADAATSKGYMEAFGIRGIPHAFIVHKGKIVWNDHPMAGLEEVIDRVVAGNFNLEEAKKLQAQRKAEEEAQSKIFEQIQQYFELARSAGKESDAAELGAKILQVAGEQPQLMNALAWEILTAEGIQTRDLKLALKAADLANSKMEGKDPSVLDTFALALFENGQKKEALEHQRKAVELAKADKRFESMLPELEQRLAKFEKEAK